MTRASKEQHRAFCLFAVDFCFPPPLIGAVFHLQVKTDVFAVFAIRTLMEAPSTKWESSQDSPLGPLPAERGDSGQEKNEKRGETTATVMRKLKDVVARDYGDGRETDSRFVPGDVNKEAGNTAGGESEED